MTAVDHYENFPVASILLPKPLRAPVAAIYRFARTADDFADEGDLPSAERLARLNSYREQLDRIETGRPATHPIFLALQPVIAHFDLPLALFRDLLDAFAQDVSKDRYADFTELMDYCRRSANPVGRLLLHLFDQASEQNLNDSDAVCSALQLINHWQDVGIDVLKGTNGRVYLPQQDMQRFNVADDSIMRRTTSTDFSNLMRFQVGRARDLMLSGAPLGWRLPGRIGLEIRAIVAGGLRILDKIEAVDYDVFTRRPTLKAIDWPAIFWHTLVRPS
jgi:squalene synthase HpnC